MRHRFRASHIIGLLGLLIVVMLLIDGVFVVLGRWSIEPARSTILLVRLVVAWTLVLVLARRLAKSDWREVFLIVPARAVSTTAGLAAGLGLSIAILSLTTWIPTPPPVSAMQLSEQLRATNQVSLAIAMLVIGPVAEELFFRGLVFPAWLQRYGFKVALLGSATLFAISHVFSWQVLVALPLGLVLGWIVFKTGSVVPAILGHCGANIAPRLFDPTLAVAGYSDRQIEEMTRVPIWVAVFGFALLIASIAMIGYDNRPR